MVAKDLFWVLRFDISWAAQNELNQADVL